MRRAFGPEAEGREREPPALVGAHQAFGPEPERQRRGLKPALGQRQVRGPMDSQGLKARSILRLTTNPAAFSVDIPRPAWLIHAAKPRRAS